MTKDKIKIKQCAFSRGKDAPVKHQLIELLWTLGPAFTRWAESHMHEYGITPQRMRLMGLLLENGAMKMSGLSDELGVSATNVTVLVDALEKDGMVVRRAHPTDRRATMIDLTPRAHKQTTENCSAFKDQVGELFSGFTKASQEQLVGLLSQMRQALIDRDILEEPGSEAPAKAAGGRRKT